MFCTGCGAKNDDNANFCVECGRPLEHVKPVKTGTFSQGTGEGIPRFTPSVPNREIPPFRGKNAETYRQQERRKINIFPVVIVVLLIGAILLVGKTLLSSGGEKSLVEKYVKAEMTGDVKTILEMFPDEVVDALCKEMGMDMSEINDRLDEELESAIKTINDAFGENWSYTCDIQKMEALSEDDIKEKEELYSEICELDITEAKNISVEIAVKGKDTETSKEMDFAIIKVKGKWYLDVISLDDLL